MKKINLLTLTVVLCAFAQSAGAWGSNHHDAIAYIAEQHLTPKAKKNIARYLDHSIVYYSWTMDKLRNTDEYSNVEHVYYVDDELNHTGSPKEGKTDCVTELKLAIERLSDYRTLSDSLVRLNLNYIIHITGDMHCPSHVKYPGVKSGRANFGGREISYHAMWDSGVLANLHEWGFVEWGYAMDSYSEKEFAEISSGNPDTWLVESAIDCRVIYDWQRDDETYDRQFVFDTHKLPEQQLVKAAYRLAAILNGLFG
jgi:hypothetical protein